MSFIKPALASPWPSALTEEKLTEVFTGTPWTAEEKLDGIRLVVEVCEPMPMTDTPMVFAWSRNAKERILPPHLLDAARELPIGVYDGELIVGRGLHSYDVANISNQKALKLALFDVLVQMGIHLTNNGTPEALARPYGERHALLEELLAGRDDGGPLVMPFAERIDSVEDIWLIADAVWEMEGEGLILKADQSLYVPGKRMKTWIKVKQLHRATLTLVGFEEGLMGPRSIAVLADDSDRTIGVKWKDFAWLEAAAASGDGWINRSVVIMYHERTPDGSYRHPRWDRFEDEAGGEDA